MANFVSLPLSFPHPLAEAIVCDVHCVGEPVDASIVVFFLSVSVNVRQTAFTSLNSLSLLA